MLVSSCHSIASDGGYSDFGIVVSTSTEDLKQMEEEHRSKIGSKVPQKSFLKEEESGKSPSGSGIFGVVLKNDMGENNCILNVIIQVLSISNFEFVPFPIGIVLFPYVVL